MSYFVNYPPRYLEENNSASNQLNVVFEMEGAASNFSITQTKKIIYYGEPGLYYGEPGLYYGGNFADPTSLEYILMESNMQISQRVEPEQGRGSASTMTFVLLDKNGEVTRFFSPGFEVDEPIGNKLVKVRIGYTSTSYPDDYFTVFRGYVSSIKGMATKSIVQLTDGNIKRRSQVFYQAKTKLSSGINNSTLDIPVISSVDFPVQILGPDSTYDPAITTYIQIDDEVMSYGPTDVTLTSFHVTRAQRGTAAAAHDADSDVTSMFQIQDNMIDIALKIMLSGWGGNWKEDQEIRSIETLSNGATLTNALELPVGVNAVDDLGVVNGDYITISGSLVGNNGTYIVQTVDSISDRINNVIKITTNFTAPETSNPDLLMAIRSKYDVYPDVFGVKLTPEEVDVSTYEQIRDTYFIGTTSLMQFYTPDPQSGKEFIEKEIMLPIGAYSVTRLGKLSMAITQQPLSYSDVSIISRDNIIDMPNVFVERATNNRRYFNEVQYNYDKSDAGLFASNRVIVDASSLSKIAISSVLPIPSSGFRTVLGNEAIIDSRGKYLIQRYTNIALYIELTVNWQTGSIIETGNVVVLRDNGELKISNYATGERNMGEQLWEVIMCNKDPKSGSVKLGLLNGTGFYYGYRYGGISPSSLIASGSTTTTIKIQDSFGSIYPGNEKNKWVRTLGQPILIHSYDYSSQYTTNLTSFSNSDPYLMNVSPALPVTPPSDWIVDIPLYPSDTSQTEQRLYKLYYTHFDPSVPVVSGLSDTEVKVAASDITKFKIGNPLFARNQNYSSISPEVLISGVDNGTFVVTVASSFGFTPNTTYNLEGIGFLDGGQPYRIS